MVNFVDFQEYDIKKDMFDLRVIENKENLPWSVFVGAAGMPGKTIPREHSLCTNLIWWF